MKNVLGLTPFKRFCMTIGNLPATYVESLTYQELLYWFCNYLEKTVIPTIDNNAGAVQELQNLFTELQSYVNNYFNNLDVQEEINNKLDEMAQNGTLQEIISAYINSNALLIFNNVNEMKQANNLIAGSKCQTLGYYEKNDSGIAEYEIEQNKSQSIDNYYFIKLNNGLIAKRIYKIEDKKRQSRMEIFRFNNIYTNDENIIEKNLIEMVNKGIYSLSITIRTHVDENGNFVLSQPWETIYNVYNKAIALGIKIHSVRISGSSYDNSVNWDTKFNEWSAFYREVVSTALNFFKNKNIKYFMPFNEQKSVYCDHVADGVSGKTWTSTGTVREQFVLDMLQMTKNAGFKTGLCLEGIEYWGQLVTAEIRAFCDFIAANLYVKIGAQGEITNTAFATDYINNYLATNISTLKELWGENKELLIMESGICDFYEAFTSPYNWTYEGYDRTGGNAIWIYWFSLFNSILQNYSKCCGIWFSENMWETNTIDMFPFYNGGVKYE